MGATSIIERNIPRTFDYLENQLLEQGNNYILYHEFMLGKGIDGLRVRFLTQYLSLLCGNNCGINNLIEIKLKGLDNLGCNN